MDAKIELAIAEECASQIVRILRALTDDGREQTMAIVGETFCPYCWGTVLPCYCTRDD